MITLLVSGSIATCSQPTGTQRRNLKLSKKKKQGRKISIWIIAEFHLTLLVAGSWAILGITLDRGCIALYLPCNNFLEWCYAHCEFNPLNSALKMFHNASNVHGYFLLTITQYGAWNYNSETDVKAFSHSAANNLWVTNVIWMDGQPRYCECLLTATPLWFTGTRSQPHFY